MKKVLITGGAGFIGSFTCDYLIEKGYDVVLLDSLNPKTHTSNWPEYINPKALKIKGNVLDEKLLTDILKKVDYVIHLAAEMDLNPDFKKFMDVNVGSTALIYEIILKENISIKKVIVASSQFVYGEGKWRCKDHGDFDAKTRSIEQMYNEKWDIKCPVCEETAEYLLNLETHQNPPNHYALSKYFQELLSINLGKLYSIPTVAMRYSIVHGPRQSLKNSYSGALRTFAINLLAGNKLATFEDNMTLRDFISVYDVAKANYMVLQNPEANYQVFNVSGDKHYTANELALCLSKKMKINLEFAPDIEFRPGDIRKALSDSSKLKQLGWEQSVSEEETLEHYVDWLKNQKIDFISFNETQKKIRKLGIVKSIYDNK
jgi:dTDP-L-rhamnose 4-epimerase